MEVKLVLNEDGTLPVHIPALKESLVVNIGRMSAETRGALILHGIKSVINDRANAGGKDATLADRREAAIEAQGKLESNAWIPGAGGGGARVTMEESAYRDAFTAILCQMGMKKTDANKAAPWPKERLEAIQKFGAAYATARGKPADRGVAALTKMVADKAAALLELKRSQFGVELDLDEIDLPETEPETETETE